MGGSNLVRRKPDIRAQVLALRQFTVGLYASLLVMRPAPVSTAQALAKDSVAGFEQACAQGALADASPELVQQSINQLERTWNDVEQALRRRGYSA